jgi:hypothetical protein
VIDIACTIINICVSTEVIVIYAHWFIELLFFNFRKLPDLFYNISDIFYAENVRYLNNLGNKLSFHPDFRWMVLTIEIIIVFVKYKDINDDSDVAY